MSVWLDLGRCGGVRQLSAHLFGGAPDRRVVAVDHGADRLAEVAQQMPSISDLDRIWRTLPHAVGVGAGPVTGNDLDAGMLTQPGGQGLRLPIGQQVDSCVAFQVDQDGPVAVAAAPGPVIDGDHAWQYAGRHVVVAGFAGEPQQRVSAHGHAQPLG